MSPELATLFRRPVQPRRPLWQRLLDQLWQAAGTTGDLTFHSECPWASATFSGTRHCFGLAFAGEDGAAAGDRLIATLADHEFALRGQLVADATVSAADHRLLPTPSLTLTCELLLLDEC